jgi:hypothetical protein
MKMSTSRSLGVMAAVAMLGLTADVSFGAAARRAGGSGYSGALSSNPATRQHQLACDPIMPISGSTSVLYNPAIVTLSTPDVSNAFSLIAGPGYSVTGFVEILSDGVRRLQEIDDGQFFPQGAETGYVQVLYTLIGSGTETGQIAPPEGFTTVDVDDAVLGVDTHALNFQYLDGVPAEINAPYTIYADRGNTHSQNTADFLTAIDDQGQQFTLTASQLQPAQVRGNVVPEPASLGLLGVAGLSLLFRRRRTA